MTAWKVSRYLGVKKVLSNAPCQVPLALLIIPKGSKICLKISWLALKVSWPSILFPEISKISRNSISKSPYYINSKAILLIILPCYISTSLTPLFYVLVPQIISPFYLCCCPIWNQGIFHSNYLTRK